MKPEKGEVWQHYKTKGEYVIVATAHLQTKIDSLDMQECIIYEAPNKTLWVRPLNDFVELLKDREGNTVPRFKKIQ